MSHSPERKEKDCLNCGTITQGRFCHVCGQENVVPKESFWGMVTHFFNDITHFDGKFFTSMRWLITKPGMLSLEYVNGRRAKYLHPIRMYVFTSAVFFIIFFSIFSAEQIGMRGIQDDTLGDAGQTVSTAAFQNAKTPEDSLAIARVLGLTSNNEKDTTLAGPKVRVTMGKAARKHRTIASYDSAQRALPSSERDNWLETQLNRRGISLEQKYGNNRRALWKDLFDTFVHSLPYMLFVSLPLYALILKMLYFRRKQYYFADHAIFLIHLYVFTFILMLIFFLVQRIDDAYPLGAWNFMKAALFIAGIYYAYRAMKNFYGQGTGKTILKFILFNLLCFFSLLLLFTVFLIFTFYRL
ncbi:MAG: DUF3667 domain-containing protein [Chitinophagaceae bacterium]|nr:DUF3667 domain-containing protein [Chitinophagaceae bacterium]